MRVASHFQSHAVACQVRHDTMTRIEAEMNMADSRTIKGQSPAMLTGHVAPVSGLYRVEHTDCLKVIWVRRGQRLPLCPECGDAASFTLHQEVQHVSEDPDFQ